jgi:flagellar basal-body rod protein FlgF
MLQGIHLAVQGMTTMMQKQDQIAHNLANVNTTGYKQSGLFTKSFQKYLANDQRQPFANREFRVDERYIDFSEGPMKKTDGKLDLTIRGTGFFTIMTPQGVRFSRNGNFSLDPDGYLVNSSGAKIMGTDGYIRLDRTSDVLVTEKGDVMQEDKRVGTLRVSDFEKPYALIREGNGYFRPEKPEYEASKAVGFTIRQGFLEASNANPIRNMVEMIATHRQFDANQRAMTSQGETLEKSIREIPRVNG